MVDFEIGVAGRASIECACFYDLIGLVQTYADETERFEFLGAYIPAAENAMDAFARRGGIGRYCRMRENMMILAGVVVASIDDINGMDKNLYDIAKSSMVNRMMIDDELISQLDIIKQSYNIRIADNEY